MKKLKQTYNMKTAKIALVLIAIASSFALRAQTEGVSIKTTASPPHQSAMLDIESTTKGLLIPRVALTSTSIAAPVSNPLPSLLVYNTATTPSATPGFYFWNGTIWSPLGAGSGTSTAQWLPGPVNLTTDIYRIGGAVTVGSLSPAGDNPNSTAKFTANGPSIFFSGSAITSPTASPSHSTISGIHLGEPVDNLGGHWNEINTVGAYLDMQFATTEDVNMGAWRGSNLSVRRGFIPTAGKGNIAADGSVTAQGFYPISDSTLKKNITETPNVLSKVNNLNTYQYNFKTEANGTMKHYGVIAQLIEVEFPELVRDETQTIVTGDKFAADPTTITTTHKTMDYDGLTAILLKAIKEQQVQINDLKARVTALEAR